MDDETTTGIVQLKHPYSEEGQVYLVGTVHISQKSARTVEELVHRVRPGVVVLELCPARLAILRLSDDDGTEQGRQIAAAAPRTMAMLVNDIVRVLQNKEGSVGVIKALLGHTMAQLGDKVKVKPGTEQRAAFKAAEAIGANVFLGDRNVEITLTRLWNALSWYEKAKLLYELLFSTDMDDVDEEFIDSLTKTDVLDKLVDELKESMPSALVPLLTERDMYLCSSLDICCKRHAVVVGVVGAGHVNGITKHWGEPIDRAALVATTTAKKEQSSSVSTTTSIVLTATAVIGTVVWWYLRHHRK